MLTLLFSLAGCSKYGQIQVTDFKIESLNLNGFRSMDLVLAVDVDNPAGKVNVKEAEGTVKQSGKIIGKVTLAPFVLRAKTRAEHKVNANVTLAEGMGLRQIMALTDMRRLQECTVDVVVKCSAGGVKVKKKYKDIPLKKLLEGNNNEKI